MNPRHHTFIRLESLTSPAGKDLVDIFENYWWVVDSFENVVFFMGQTPQCNPKKEEAEALRDLSYPGYEVRQIPFVFIPLACEEFDYDV